MKDLAILFMERPLVGFMTVLIMAVGYLYVALGTINAAVAGLEVRSEDAAETRTVILQINERSIRMDQTLLDLKERIKDE